MEDQKSITFNIFQWNTLNKRLSDKKSFPYVEDKFLEWDYRHPLIKKIIEENKGDIIGLQEVGKFEKDFKEAIFDKCSIKYDAINESKKTSMENVLGINKELFSIEKHEIIHLEGLDGKKSGRHMICALIIDKKTNNKFIVLVVHLTAKAEKENIRLFQMDHIIRYIEKNLLGKYPIFFLGDFNAEPTYPSMVKFFENKNICPKSLFDLKELDFTTIKLRDVLYRRVIDYIFFIPKNKDDVDKELKILSVEKAKPVLDEKIGLPNDIFPSDHLFLKAKVELTFT